MVGNYLGHPIIVTGDQRPVARLFQKKGCKSAWPEEEEMCEAWKQNLMLSLSTKLSYS
jgi:hypothetical protein